MKRNGYSLVEVIIAIGLVMIFIPAIMTTFTFALRTSSQGEKFTKAAALAREGMDVIFALKSASWSWTTYDPAEDTYQIRQVSGAWETYPKPATPDKDGIFTRTIDISYAQRCTPYSQPCDSGGTTDNGLRKVTVTVTWPEAGSEQKVTVSTYVAKY